jgi:CHAT domain-containing protein
MEMSYSVLQSSSSSIAAKAISMLAARFAAGSGELSQLVRKDQDLTTEAERLDKDIVAAVSKIPTERNAAVEAQIRKRIDEIKSERDGLQRLLGQRFPGYAALSKPQPLSVYDTQALLAADEALVVIDVEESSYVWVITKDKAQWKLLSVNADYVTKEVTALRAALDPDAVKPFDFGIANQLYRQFLGPIEDVISSKTRLSFVLNGALTSLPPQVLITSDPEGKDLAAVDWLIRKYAITVLPSAASLKILRSGKSIVAATKPLIGFGDPILDMTAQTAPKAKFAAVDGSLPTFYRGVIIDTKSLSNALPALPETSDELRAVAKRLGARDEDVKLGKAATVTNVKHARLSDYQVVYFATHALVAGDVEKFAKVKAEPALVLSIPDKPSEEDDGLLRASDVAMLKMNADFAVLSACNTAAGDKPGAEALSGLARAFFYAGARSLIVSNWEVDSESTVALMTGLFDALKANPTFRTLKHFVCQC